MNKGAISFWVLLVIVFIIIFIGGHYNNIEYSDDCLEKYARQHCESINKVFNNLAYITFQNLIRFECREEREVTYNYYSFLEEELEDCITKEQYSWRRK